MTTINEIAPGLFRLSIFVPDIDMQFNHFLVREEEPLLFHAGFKVAKNKPVAKTNSSRATQRQKSNFLSVEN